MIKHTHKKESNSKKVGETARSGKSTANTRHSSCKPELSSQQQIGNRMIKELIRRKKNSEKRKLPKSVVSTAHPQREKVENSASRVSPRNHLSGREKDSENETALKGGRPLDVTTRRFMEERFGRDLSDVRLHTGAKAADSARRLGAKAYTVNSHVVFGANQYNPTSMDGQRLLAHELTHVLQQRASNSVPSSSSTDVIPENDDTERQADHIAESVVDSDASPIRSVEHHGGISGSIQRQTLTPASSSISKGREEKQFPGLTNQPSESKNKYVYPFEFSHGNVKWGVITGELEIKGKVELAHPNWEDSRLLIDECKFSLSSPKGKVQFSGKPGEFSAGFEVGPLGIEGSTTPEGKRTLKITIDVPKLLFPSGPSNPEEVAESYAGMDLKFAHQFDVSDWNDPHLLMQEAELKLEVGSVTEYQGRKYGIMAGGSLGLKTEYGDVSRGGAILTKTTGETKAFLKLNFGTNEYRLIGFEETGSTSGTFVELVELNNRNRRQALIYAVNKVTDEIKSKDLELTGLSRIQKNRRVLERINAITMERYDELCRRDEQTPGVNLVRTRIPPLDLSFFPRTIMPNQGWENIVYEEFDKSEVGTNLAVALFSEESLQGSER